MNSRARAVQARLDAADRRVGDARDLVVGEALDVAQDEHGAVRAAEALDLDVEARAALAALELVGRAARGDRAGDVLARASSG